MGVGIAQDRRQSGPDGTRNRRPLSPCATDSRRCGKAGARSRHLRPRGVGVHRGARHRRTRICAGVEPSHHAGTHRGGALGVDLCAALRARIDGVPCDSRSGLDDGEEGFYDALSAGVAAGPVEPLSAELPRRRAMGRARAHRGHARVEARSVTEHVSRIATSLRRAAARVAVALWAGSTVATGLARPRSRFPRNPFSWCSRSRPARKSTSRCARSRKRSPGRWGRPCW